MTRTLALTLALLAGGCASDELNAFAFPDRIVITSPLADFAQNHTERAMLAGHEYGHIVLGHADDRFVTDHERRDRELVADAWALKAIAEAGLDTCLIPDFFRRIKAERPRANAIDLRIALAEAACERNAT